VVEAAAFDLDGCSGTVVDRRFRPTSRYRKIAAEISPSSIATSPIKPGWFLLRATARRCASTPGIGSKKATFLFSNRPKLEGAPLAQISRSSSPVATD